LTEKSSDKKVVIIVDGLENMLKLLDQGYEVVEELNGERFRMAKKSLPTRA